MTKAITEARIRQIIASYGSSAAHWPDEEREAAMAAAAFPEGAALLRREAALDDLLAQYEVPLPDAAAIHRFAATAPRPRRWLSLPQLWWSSAALAGTGFAGVALGMVLLPMADSNPPLQTADSYALSYDFSIGQDAS